MFGKSDFYTFLQVILNTELILNLYSFFTLKRKQT